MMDQSIPSPTELDAASAPPQRKLDRYFEISARQQYAPEVVAGITTFMAMVYAVFVVPGMLGKAGFDTSAVFVAVCLTTAFGSLLMGMWARLPIAIGCAISLTAFVAFGPVLGQKLTPSVALGAVFLMGVVFTAISVTGVRSDPAQPAGRRGARRRHRHRPVPAADRLQRRRPGGQEQRRRPAGHAGQDHRLPGGDVGAGPGRHLRLERRRVPGGILLVIVGISALGPAFDPR